MRNRLLAVAGLLASTGVLGLAQASATPPPATSTPIKHLVVIFQENVSFDHYFGTYPDRHEPGRRAGLHAQRRHTPRSTG